MSARISDCRGGRIDIATTTVAAVLVCGAAFELAAARAIDVRHSAVSRRVRPLTRSWASHCAGPRVCEMKAQGLWPTAIAKALGIGRASIYRVLEARY
jgi:hypothetical protein